jgi:sulfur carrier protein
MQIFVNEAELELPEPATVSDLLRHLELPATRVAVELNRQLVRRAEHTTTAIKTGDRLEVVTLVGGG